MNNWNEVAQFFGSQPRAFLAHFLRQLLFFLLGTALMAAGAFGALRSAYPLVVMAMALAAVAVLHLFVRLRRQRAWRYRLLRAFGGYQPAGTQRSCPTVNQKMKALRTRLQNEGIKPATTGLVLALLALPSREGASEDLAIRNPNAIRALAAQAARQAGFSWLIFFLLWLPFLLISLAFTFGRPLLAVVLIHSLGLLFAWFLHAALAEPILLLLLAQKAKNGPTC